ncbi:hypothetical protein [Paracidovorax sp. MALMAid1276]
MLTMFWTAAALAVLAGLGCAAQMVRDLLARLPGSNGDWVFY